jgi:hypothetical protein
MQTYDDPSMFAVGNRVSRPMKTNILSQGAWFYGTFGQVDYGAEAVAEPRSVFPKKSGLKAMTIESGKSRLRKADDENVNY